MPTPNVRLARCGLLAMSVLGALAVSGAVAARKMPDELPSTKQLPDALVKADGSKVASKDEWPARREALKELVLAYEYGHLPPASPVSASEQTWTPGKAAEKYEAKRAENPVPLPAGATETQLVLRTGPDRKIAIPVVLTRPAGKGPFPAIIRGDLCWGRVSTQVAAEVVKRGYILAE